jgi:hypothetical protein
VSDIRILGEPQFSCLAIGFIRAVVNAPEYSLAHNPEPYSKEVRMLYIMFVGLAVATWLTVQAERLNVHHPTGDPFRSNWGRYVVIHAAGAVGALAGNYLFARGLLGSDPMPGVIAVSSVATGLVRLAYR